MMSLEQASEERWVRADRDGTVLYVHEQLRAIASMRSELDAQELRLLREVKRLKLWRDLGYATLFEYLESEVGYSPRTASDRMRVAEALDELPQLESALAENELAYSAIRELARVAAPDTVEAWIDAAAGKNLREIEELVSGHKYGARPEDPPDPSLRRRDVTFEDVLPETQAMIRQARVAADAEHGEHLDDNLFLQLLVKTYLSGSASGNEVPRPAYQMSITTCRACKRSAQIAAGRTKPVGAAAVACASCDADFIGSLDGQPERVTSSVTARVREQVFQRDRFACTVPGCRVSRNLEIHHVEHQAHGGRHQLWNLTLICFGHHKLHHEGRLDISGRAPDRLVFVPRSRLPRDTTDHEEDNDNDDGARTHVGVRWD